MILTVMAFSMLMAVSANAAEISGNIKANPGSTIEIDASTGIPGSDVMRFNPSPQVQMSWWTNRDGFAHNAVHTAAIETPGGMVYGMAGDTNKVFWMSAAPANFALTAVSTANSTEFKGADPKYYEMK